MSISQSINNLVRQGGELFLEQVSLTELASHYGTPSYVYSLKTIVDNYNQWATAGSGKQRICYAVKANSNITILQLLASLGSSFDIVSIGEFHRVIHAGGQAVNIVFSGVGKTASDIETTLDAGIHCFNVESESELHLIAEVAERMSKPAPISIRVNPNVDAMTHPYISTGLKQNKFGVDAEKALALYQWVAQHDYLKPMGIDCHIGSQLLSIEPLIDSFECLLKLIEQLNQRNIHLQHIDLGGGIGVSYSDDELPPNIGLYIETIEQHLAGRSERLMFEPGRSIIANAGVLLTEVLHTKISGDHRFAIVDAAMNDYLRPALYSAWNRIEPVQEDSSVEAQEWDIVGPICESADFLAKKRTIRLKQQCLLAMLDVGAYGFSMSSNYNSRPKVSEILVNDRNHYLIRQRESFADIIRGEPLMSNISALV